MRKLLLFTFTIFSFLQLATAQIGGLHTYEFLDLPGSARITANGGIQIAVMEDDIAMAYQNPALYNKEMHQKIQIGHQLYFSDIQNGYATAAYQLKEKITISAGLQYISYGQFDRTDNIGNVSGTFTAKEYALVLGGAYTTGKWSYGINTKWIGSYFDQYTSFGAAADIGIAYNDTSSLFTTSLVFKNVGTQFSTYVDTKEALPFDIQFGISKRLKYVPFRIGVMLHHLHQWDIRYDDPALQSSNTFIGDTTTVAEKTYFIDKLFRHVNFTGEFYFGKALNIRIGYNYLRRQELSIESRPWASGFSGGVGIRVKRFSIDYGKAFYSLPASTNHFTVGFRL